MAGKTVFRVVRKIENICFTVDLLCNYIKCQAQNFVVEVVIGVVIVVSCCY